MSSSSYWRKREADQLAKNIIDEAQYTKVISNYYDYMLDLAQKEINEFYTRYAKTEGISMAEAKKRVSQLDMDAYERKAAKYVKDKTFTKEANDEMRLYNATMKINRLELLKANIGLEVVDGYNDLQKYFDQILTDRTLAEFSRQSGILGSTIANSEKAAHAIVNASFHNAKFSDRLWLEQDVLKSELSKLLRQGLIQGKHPRVLAKQLRNLFDAGRDDALRLMRTELARVQIEAQRQSYERNGYEEYVFIAEPTACKDCAALDNSEPLKVKDMMPGTNAPPIHPNCRCSTAAYMDREEFDKWLENQRKHDIIMARKKGSSEGTISKAQYNKIVNPYKKKGANIHWDTGESREYFKRHQDASAMTIGDTVYFRKTATVSDVLEEMFHLNQNYKGVNNDKPEPLRSILNEIEAKEFLLRETTVKKYKIPESETAETKKHLEYYKKELEYEKKNY